MWELCSKFRDLGDDTGKVYANEVEAAHSKLLNRFTSKGMSLRA